MNNERINKNIVKKQDNILILKRRKKKKIRRVAFLFLLISVILIILLLNLNIFKIQKIEFIGNENAKIAEVEIKATDELIGKNIFIVNYDKILNDISKDPYVDDVIVRKRIPNKINFVINEKKTLFYINNGKYVILDKDGTVLEIDNEVKNGIIEIIGIDIDDDIKLKDNINLDKFHKDLLHEFADLFSRNTSGLNPYKLDVGNLTNLNLFVNDIEIKMGDLYNLKYKLNFAFTIIDEYQLADKSGYIDVSDHNLPVYNCQ